MFFDKIFIYLWRRKALNSFVSNEFEKSLKYFKKIYKKNPNEKGIRYNLGLVSLAMKNFKEAKNYFKENYLRNQNYINTKALGDVYYLWGKQEKAINYYQKSLKKCKDKRDENFINNRIEICKDDKKFDKSLKSQNYVDKGMDYLNNEKYDKAMDKFKKAAEMDKTNFVAYNNIATIFMNQKNNYEKALEYFEKANSLIYNPVVKQNINKLNKVISNIEKEEDNSE